MDATSEAPATGPVNPASLGSSRAARGLALFRERGSEITEVSPGTYRVPSCTSEATYTVDLERAYCSCPDRAEVCKHQVACTIVAAKKRCRRAARPTGRPTRRHGQTTPRPQEQPDGQRQGSGPSRRDDGLRGVLVDPARLDRTAERLGV